MKRLRLMGILFTIVMLFISGCSTSSSEGTIQTVTPVPNATAGEYFMDEILGPVAEGEVAPQPGNDSLIAGTAAAEAEESRLGEGTIVVVISDIHMGDQRSIDDGYGWFIKNEDLLEDFLNHVAVRPAVKELVIAGDVFDEWVTPMQLDALNNYGSDQAGESKFVDSIAKAHPKVIGAFRNVISKGIKVTYVPGNHDMLVTHADLERVFPGIHQNRDAPGLGSYSPDGLDDVLIEHSHRYDFFNAPDMYSNKIPASPEDYTDNPDAKLPPGFFVSKMAATHGVTYPALPAPETVTGDGQNKSILLYWGAWKAVLAKVKPTEDRNAKIIKTGIDGYTAEFSINDLTPRLEGLSIKDPTLYKKIEDNWKKRQEQNLVNVPINVASALLVGSVDFWCDFQANTQYFLHDTTKRIVIFGHTHHATLGTRFNKKLQKCIYANSGTWIDSGNPSRTFVVIRTVPQYNGKIKEYVSVYQFNENHKAKKLHEDSITR